MAVNSIAMGSGGSGTPPIISAASRPRSRRQAARPPVPAGPDPRYDLLVTRLGAPDAESRWHAAQALARAGDAAVASLLMALEHSDAYVRRHASEVLGRIGGDRAAEALIGRLHDPSPLVRERAAEALAVLARPEAAHALQIVLVADTVPGVRAEAAEALGRCCGRGSVIPLVAATSDASAQVRWSAASALACTGSRRAVAPLIRLLSDPDAGVRCAAADALGRLASRKAQEPLANAMRDADPWVRWHAVDALSRLRGPRIVQIFFSALDDPEAGVRWRAASALGQAARGYDAVVDALTTLLSDFDATVRSYAVQALGELGDVRALPAVRRLLDDQSATAYLGKVGDVAWVAARKLERRARRASA